MRIKVLAPNRAELEAFAGRKVEVEAVYVRTGIRTLNGRSFDTVLLRDVRSTQSGAVLADHLWFNRGRIWRRAGLRSGDVVRFEARSIEYRTGHWGPDRLRRMEEPPRRDFKLTPPESLQVIRRAGCGRGEAA
jgi:hypothetical protein